MYCSTMILLILKVLVTKSLALEVPAARLCDNTDTDNTDNTSGVFRERNSDPL